MKRITLLVLLLVSLCLASNAFAQFQPPVLLRPGDSLLTLDPMLAQIKSVLGQKGEVAVFEKHPSNDSLYLPHFNSAAVQEKLTEVIDNGFVYDPKESLLVHVGVVKTGETDTSYANVLGVLLPSTDSLKPGVAIVASMHFLDKGVTLPPIVTYQYAADPGDPSFTKMTMLDGSFLWSKMEMLGIPTPPTNTAVSVSDTKDGE